MQELATTPTMLLFALRDVLLEVPDRTSDLDLSETDVENARKRLVESVRCTLSLLNAVERATSTEDARSTVDADAWVADDAPETTVADMCFAALMELRRVERALTSATSLDDRQIAIELGIRKLRRAIRAVLECARDRGVADVLGGVHQGAHNVSDVESGIAVRRLYAEFRAALRQPADESPPAVMEAMRYTASALAMMLSSPDYLDVRTADRTLLRGLRERVLRWAREDRGVRSGLDLLADVASSSELLRGINQRQELRRHDLLVVQALVAETDPGRWPHHLASLRGLDDSVDRLGSQLPATTDPSDRDRIAERLLDRLRQLTGVSA